MTELARLEIVLSMPTYAALKAWAEQQEIPMSELIEQLVEAMLKNRALP